MNGACVPPALLSRLLSGTAKKPVVGSFGALSALGNGISEHS
jgi:hypothetical protein